MRGRKPTPTVLKLLRGNPGKRKLNPREPKPAPLTADVPPELTATDAIDEWQRTVVPAIRTGQITTVDRVLAIAHCDLWATWRSQLADAAKHAHVVSSGPNHHPIPNPARTMANRTFALLARVDAELGFSPTSRSRVQLAKGHDTDADNKWEGIL